MALPLLRGTLSEDLPEPQWPVLARHPRLGRWAALLVQGGGACWGPWVGAGVCPGNPGTVDPAGPPQAHRGAFVAVASSSPLPEG